MKYPNIKKCRQDKEMTQQEVADLLNISQSTYSDFERGKSDPAIEYLLKMSQIFEQSVDFLIESSDEY